VIVSVAANLPTVYLFLRRANSNRLLRAPRQAGDLPHIGEGGAYYDTGGNGRFWWSWNLVRGTLG
jgi:hypothetical protein